MIDSTLTPCRRSACSSSRSVLDVHLLHDVRHLLVHLDVVDADPFALGLLELEPVLDHALEEPVAQGNARVRGGPRFLRLVQVVGLRLVELEEGDGVVVHDADPRSSMCS